MNTNFTMNRSEKTATLTINWKNGDLGQNLSVDEAENVVKSLTSAAGELTREAFKQWIMQFDSTEDVIIVNGLLYRFKMVANKEFLTKFGHVTIPRRIYQQDNGGPVYVPLDEAWDMRNQFAASDVRGSLLHLSALLSPEEVAESLDEIASFMCSKTAIQNIVNEMGEELEKYEDELLDVVRSEEEIPFDKLKVVSVSLDGANVRLNTPGPKKGRPTERPKDDAAMSRETASCYKNAMVGVVSYYGDVPEKENEMDDPGPERLAGHCLGRMPEGKFPTFRKKLEAEVSQTLDRIPLEVAKVVLNDGGTNLWNYVDSTPLYDDFEKIVDFHHALEHISSAAEGIFGKGTAEGQVWYRKMEGTLLAYEDGTSRVIDSLEYYLKAKEYLKTPKSLIESCLTFMRNNAHRMEYKRFRDKGWPIGSGPVEGACKNLVKKRMCQGGQRWSIRGGQAILTLRAIVKSKRWPMFWNAYKKHRQCKRLPSLTHST